MLTAATQELPVMLQMRKLSLVAVRKSKEIRFLSGVIRSLLRREPPWPGIDQGCSSKHNLLIDTLYVEDFSKPEGQ